MANESTAESATGGQTEPGPRPLAPAERARLTQCYNRGAQAVDGKPPNLDYAIEMFSICVLGDPAGPVYVQSLLGALKLKHGAKKSGGLSALFGGGGVKGSLKKLASKGQWRDVLKQGVDLLKGSPHDQHCLLAMAEACGSLGLLETQAVYLRAALDAAPLDPDVNRQCASFATSQGQFDQAIECYRRVARVKGLAEEAEREISRLSVEKTINAGKGLVGRQGPDKPAAPADAAPHPAADAATPKDRVATLQRQIKAEPTAIDPYLELADLLERDASVEEAEKVLASALAASGNDLKVQEHVEDRQLRWARHKVLLAEQRLAGGDTPEARALVDRLKAEQLRREIDIYASRAARYPENIVWKYELALRLKSAGNHTEAIRHFQEVLQDPRRKGVVSLELGECFQKIKQYELAMRNYETAVALLTEREADQRKRALYRAGVLATGLGDVDSARKHLSSLAGLDFGYRDVASRLDKLGSGGDNKSGGES